MITTLEHVQAESGRLSRIALERIPTLGEISRVLTVFPTLNI